MTEKKTETYARGGGLAWQKARRLLSSSSPAKELPDWPDAIIPADLAALQYPREGTNPEKRKAKSNQLAMVVALDAAIQAGKLGETITLQREVIKMESGRFPGMELFGQWIPASSYSRKVSAGIKEYQAIHRRPFAVWLDDQGEEPGEHIRAWLGDAWPVAAAHPATATPARKGRKPVSDPSESKVAERRAYLRSVWLEKEKPNNDGVWKELKERQGKDGCPIIKVDTRIRFTFRYSDETERPINHHTFQTDMSAIKNQTPE